MTSHDFSRLPSTVGVYTRLPTRTSPRYSRVMAFNSTTARIAALTRWANEDPSANAARGQEGLRRRFRREVEEKFPGLPEPEVSRRAEAAYRAHMATLAAKPRKKRRP